MVDLAQASDSELANKLAEERDADVMFFNGEITRGVDFRLISDSIDRSRRSDVILMLITPGGDPDVAYRIARCLQRKYRRFSLYISGYCKSAGTLIALGAHELIISDHGELGPLDVQMMKKDDLVQRQSGLAVMAALEALHEKAFSAFEKYFLETTAKGGGTITVNTAADIATKLTTGLFAPLYQQIDPLLIGEAGRALTVADSYGDRLLRASGNATAATLKFLATDYPSHGFVIDREEASVLFSHVREPDEIEVALAERMGETARWPSFRGGEVNVIRILSDEPAERATPEEKLSQREATDHGESRGVASTEPQRIAESAREKVPSGVSGAAGTVTSIAGKRKEGG